MFYPSIKAAPRDLDDSRVDQFADGLPAPTSTAWAGWWSWSAAGSTARRAFLISPTAPSLRASGDGRLATRRLGTAPEPPADRALGPAVSPGDDSNGW